MPDYVRIIKRPFSDFRKLAIGTLLGILPIINFFVFGYALEAAKTVFNKKYELPEWKNLANLFVRGLVGVIISLIYLLPAYILSAILLVNIMPSITSVIADLYAGNAASFFTAFTGLIAYSPLLVIAFLLFLFAVYLIPSAIMHYLKQWKFSEAFDFNSVFNKAFTGNYFVTWLLIGVIYSAIFSLVVGILIGWIPVIGSLIMSGLISFVLSITQFTAFAEVFKEKR